MGDGGAFKKVYVILGAAILVAYLYIEAQGIIFGGTDSKYEPSSSWSSWSSGGRSWSGGRSSGWGYSGGFHGGK